MNPCQLKMRASHGNDPYNGGFVQTVDLVAHMQAHKLSARLAIHLETKPKGLSLLCIVRVLGLVLG